MPKVLIFNGGSLSGLAELGRHLDAIREKHAEGDFGMSLDDELSREWEADCSEDDYTEE